MDRCFSVCLTALAISFAPVGASAQEGTEVSATGKGITGGALLGAEAVMLTEAAIGAKPWWAYLIGGVAGAAGGGVGGYFVEQGDAKASLYLLAGGMALVIPTTVAVLSRTAYEPPTEYTQDAPPADEPVAEPPAPSGARQDPVGRASRVIRPVQPARLEMARASATPSLLGVRHKTLSLSVPAVQIREVFSRRELHELGVKQAPEVRVPLFSAAF